MHSCWRRLVADLDLILQSTSLVRGNRPAFRGFTKLAAQVPHTLYPHTAHNTLSVLWGVSVVVVPLGRTRVLRELIGWSGIPRTRPVVPPPDDPRCPNPARRRRRCCWAFVWHPRRHTVGSFSFLVAFSRSSATESGAAMSLPVESPTRRRLSRVAIRRARSGL